ncbi:MAG: signal peptidase I [Candidatus Binatia bacterium]
MPRRKSTAREYVEALGTALLLALAIRTFVVQAFKIPSESMVPTLLVGDHILVNKFIYGPRIEVPLTQWSLGRLPGWRKPRPGDVVVFIWPKDRSKDFIKRVIAVEGQTIEVRNNQVYIDGQAWDDPHARFQSDPETRSRLASRAPCGSLPPGGGADCATYTVPPGHVFVLGDNRDKSYDSRFWGPVPIEDIKGLALVIYWSWDGVLGRWSRIGRLVS